MKSKQFVLKILFAGLLIFTVLNVRAAEVMVFAAASLTDALKQVAINYQKQSGDTVVCNFAASSTLARQIAAGAPADIFFSADEAKMNDLEKKGLIVADTRKDRLGNSLVVIAPVVSTLTIHSAVDLTDTNLQQIALADPKAVPVGIYAKSWLQKENVWTVIQPKVIPTGNVRGALAAVASGNVDAGVVFKTDAAISKKVKVIYEVPTNDTTRICYPVALVKDSPQPVAARKFLDFLATKEAGQVFRHFGFIVLK